MRATACTLALLYLAVATHASDVAPPSPPPTALFSNLPLLFVENRGQLDEAVRFSVPGSGRSLYFTRDGITVALEGDGQRWALKLDFMDANPDVVLRGKETQQAVFSYFKGNDPAKWKTGCPTYSEIAYENLWPGIDLVYRGAVNRLKHEFVVAPGADPRRIRFEVSGATAVRLDGEGDLVLETPLGSFEDAHPTAWQERDGVHVDVVATFALDGTQVTFALGAFDPSLPLVLDPETIVYSGFLGGSGHDVGYGIAVDASGAAYITGDTISSNFPTVGGPDPSYNGSWDAFVAKVNPNGNTLLYSGFLGGSYADGGRGIAVDGSGAAYVTGYTASADFPTLGGLPSNFNGFTDAFMAKLDAMGSVLVYSGYVGGSGWDTGRGIAVHSSGNAYVTGSTDSVDSFPVAGSPDPTYNGGTDAFICSVDPAGNSFIYSGYLGGTGGDSGRAIAVDPSGAAYVTGWTNSVDFPTGGGVGSIPGGYYDAFVTKLNQAGGITYSGYLGGSIDDFGRGIAIDASGAAYVTGETRSANFPTVGNLGPELQGGMDVFVSKVSPDGASLVFSGLFGGPNPNESLGDFGRGIAVDAMGSCYVVGNTASSYGDDLFVARISAGGDAIEYVSAFGGSGADIGYGIALDPAGGIYITGETSSIDFPTAGLLGQVPHLMPDAFVMKLALTESVLCRVGTIGRPAGTHPRSVLRINGSAGDLDRVVVATIGSPIEITMNAPPLGPSPAPFALYAWMGAPNESTVTPQPKGVGTMCLPTPVTGGLPQPKRIWNNIGHYPLLGYPHFPSAPAPSTPFSTSSGVPFAITATFQGFIFDNGSSARHPASITNAVILQVTP